MAVRTIFSCDSCEREWLGSGNPKHWGTILFSKCNTEVSGFNSFEFGEYLVCQLCINNLRETFPLLQNAQKLISRGEASI